MKWVYALLVLYLTTICTTFKSLTSSHGTDASIVDVREEAGQLEHAPIRDENYALAEEFDARMDALANQDQDLVLNPINSSSTDPLFPCPRRFLQVGYGLQWKKGLQNWVAFPLVGLLGCKRYTTLGRMSVGEKHSSCQKSFQINGKWHRLDGCNPITGMPKHLLDAKGNIVASCTPKRSKLLCLVEGKIYVRGTCEDPPPDANDGMVDNWEQGED